MDTINPSCSLERSNHCDLLKGVEHSCGPINKLIKIQHFACGFNPLVFVLVDLTTLYGEYRHIQSFPHQFWQNTLKKEAFGIPYLKGLTEMINCVLFGFKSSAPLIYTVVSALVVKSSLINLF